MFMKRRLAAALRFQVGKSLRGVITAPAIAATPAFTATGHGKKGKEMKDPQSSTQIWHSQEESASFGFDVRVRVRNICAWLTRTSPLTLILTLHHLLPPQLVAVILPEFRDFSRDVVTHHWPVGAEANPQRVDDTVAAQAETALHVALQRELAGDLRPEGEVGDGLQHPLGPAGKDLIDRERRCPLLERLLQQMHIEALESL